jgi:diguanylate cyclase
MKYDFSKSLKHEDGFLEEFIDSYTSCISFEENDKSALLIERYKVIFKTFEAPFESEKMIELYEDFAHFKIANEVPYVIIANEIYGLKNLLLKNIQEREGRESVVALLNLFKEIDNKVANIYLLKYIEKLISTNHVRRNSLSDLVGMDVLRHYESHLIWLTSLAERIRDSQKSDFPQLDDTMCEFGKWMHGEAKILIQNNSKYNTIKRIHANLHLFAKKIYMLLDKKEDNILINYLEKCELMSLSIGTELALIDNILINKKITKDTLTGSLSRQGLRSVFQNQYELSFATGNPFVLAMCDLDYFKQINDTYGHIAGDKVLKSFVDIVKQNIRSSDVIVRYGGEEFIIMLPAVHKAKGLEALEKIRKAFEANVIEFNDEKIKATVSIGVIEVEPEHGSKPSCIDEYLMIVDQKLYIAKESGRNRIEEC